MPQDAPPSLPIDTNIPNGDEISTRAHDDTAEPPRASLPELCREIHQRVQAFLQRDPRSEKEKGADPELIRRVQEQTRASLRVVGEALGTFE